MTSTALFTGNNSLVNSFALSVDQDYFHRIHNIEVGEKGNKDREQDLREDHTIRQQKVENEQDHFEHFADLANKEFAKQRKELLNKIRNLNGFEFTDVDLDKTIKDILQDQDAFQTKHNLNDEEMDAVFHHALLMEAMSPEERAEHLKGLAEKKPTIANAFAKDAEMNMGQRESKLEKIQTVEASQQANDFFSDFPEGDALASKAESVITSNFTAEVANIGANAQSFKFVEPQQPEAKASTTVELNT